SHALNTIQHTLISTLSSITLDEVNQTIVTKYRLNDLNQWVITNSKTL
ncbi:Rrf2 family transcriptional regulator, partial [Staphylococcus haemolyticus]